MPQRHHDPSHGGSSPPPPPLWPSKPKESFLSLILKAIIMMLLISFFFLLLLPLASLLLLLSLLLRHQRHRHLRHSHSSSGFSPKQVKMIPQFRFLEGTEATRLESDSCVICLDGFKQGQWCRHLVGCGHFFHRKCVDVWLTKVAACPICRTKVCFDHEDKGLWGFGTRRTDFQGLLDL